MITRMKCTAMTLLTHRCHGNSHQHLSSHRPRFAFDAYDPYFLFFSGEMGGFAIFSTQLGRFWDWILQLRRGKEPLPKKSTDLSGAFMTADLKSNLQ